MKQFHFYVAFNPLFNDEDYQYKTQAHEFHFKLREKIRKDPKSYMYWGKIRVSDYSEPFIIQNYKTALDFNVSRQKDTYLFITDYQNLWVGKVEEVTSEKPDQEKTLDFYKDKNVEVWFKLTDFHLVTSTASATIARLQSFYVDNEFYKFKLKEVTPYTASIRFPMIVEDHIKETFFSFKSKEKRILMEMDLNCEVGSQKYKEITRSFVIPEKNFRLLPETVRTKIYMAELLLLEAQGHDKHDRVKLEESLMNYLLALEILMNETFIKHIKNSEGHRIYVNTEDKPKLMRAPPDSMKNMLMRLRDFDGVFSLGQIKMLMDTPSFFSHTVLDHVFRSKKLFWEYCRLELRPTLKNESILEILQALREKKDLKALDRELLLIRNLLLGIGGSGIFNSLIEKYYEMPGIKSKTA